ncbi:MAG: N-acetylmuramoyl-L-alanine amidase [Myxococcales bacterium]|nr:N-acetylmuramoyl-L-alanine amidase [Myxococcales bacterium]
MAIERGERGPEVVKLQRMLLALGYRLPRWGADGDMGSETFGAVARFMEDHGRIFDDDADRISDEEQAFVAQLHEQLGHPLPLPVGSAQFFDLRAQADRRHIIRRRSWHDVTGICLHQTACVLGETPQRWDSVGAHLGISREGKVMWMFDFDTAVVHANGLNASTVGIEMDGTYAGIGGDLRTFWRPADEPDRQPQAPTPELIDAARATVRWICAEVERHGGRITRLLAHRQASRNRRSDPGSELWQAVAMPLHEELGLTDGGKGYKLGTGYAVPEAWNPAYRGVRY